MVVRAQFTKRVPAEFNVKNIAIIMGSLAAFALLSAYVNMSLAASSPWYSSLHSRARTIRCAATSTIAAVLIGIAFAFREELDLQLPLY